jgi:hypothetical protein
MTTPAQPTPDIGAIFADHDAAEEAVAALRSFGLADEHLGVAVAHHDDLAFESDHVAGVRSGVGAGIAVGAPIGIVAGMTVLTVLAPGSAGLGVGGLLAAGGFSGALAGTYLGGLLGLASKHEVVEDERDWEQTRLAPGEVMIVVGGHGDPDTVADVLARAGGRIVAKPAHHA